MDDMPNFDDDIMPKDIADAEICYPDGFGLSIVEVQALLAKLNETIVSKDDPILLTVTILNAFLEENNKLQIKYQDALKTIYAEQVKEFLSSMQKNSDAIKTSLQSLSIESLNKIHNKQVREWNRFNTHLIYASITIALSAIMNIAVFIWS